VSDLEAVSQLLDKGSDPLGSGPAAQDGVVATFDRRGRSLRTLA